MADSSGPARRRRPGLGCSAPVCCAVYVSAFWSRQFFTDLTWTLVVDLASYPQVTATFNQTVLLALADGETTALGKAVESRTS